MYLISWTNECYDFNFCYGFKSLYDARHWTDKGYKVNQKIEKMYKVVIKNNHSIIKRGFNSLEEARSFVTRNTKENDDFVISPPSFTRNYNYKDDIGYMYILINPAIPDLINLGFTLDEPNKILEIMSAGTGMPAEFIMAYQQIIYNFYETKQHIKDLLLDYLIKGTINFYKIKIKDALEITKNNIINMRDDKKPPIKRKQIFVISKKYNVTKYYPFENELEAKEFATALHFMCWNVFMKYNSKKIYALAGSRGGGIGFTDYIEVDNYDCIDKYIITSRNDRDELRCKGYIYILENEFMPGLLKIGKTKQQPVKRARDISRGINIPGKFTVSYKRIVSEYTECERTIHKLLSDYRYNEDREFFSISLNDAVRIIDSYIDSLPDCRDDENSINLFQ